MTDTAIYCNIHKRPDVDSCQVCEDEKGPDPTLVRYFICEASIKQSDLTDNGEYPEGESWQEMEGQIRDRLLTWSGYHSEPFLTLKYWGWESQDCPLCFKPSDIDGTPHNECTDREQAQADRPVGEGDV